MLDSGLRPHPGRLYFISSSYHYSINFIVIQLFDPYHSNSELSSFASSNSLWIIKCLVYWYFPCSSLKDSAFEPAISALSSLSEMLPTPIPLEYKVQFWILSNLFPWNLLIFLKEIYSATQERFFFSYYLLFHISELQKYPNHTHYWLHHYFSSWKINSILSSYPLICSHF